MLILIRKHLFYLEKDFEILIITLYLKTVSNVFSLKHVHLYLQKCLIINLRLENCIVKMIENSFINYLVT
jgi:hypothetical protein